MIMDATEASPSALTKVTDIPRGDVSVEQVAMAQPSPKKKKPEQSRGRFDQASTRRSVAVVPRITSERGHPAPIVPRPAFTRGDEIHVYYSLLTLRRITTERERTPGLALVILRPQTPHATEAW